VNRPPILSSYGVDPGCHAPKLVSRDLVRAMKPVPSSLTSLSIRELLRDQPPTTHAAPTMSRRGLSITA